MNINDDPCQSGRDPCGSAPSTAEIEILERAWAALQDDGGAPLHSSVFIAELILLGIASERRARALTQFAFSAPGGFALLDGADDREIAWTIWWAAPKLETKELVELVNRRHPAATVKQIVAELRRQAAADFTDAAELAGGVSKNTDRDPQ